MFFETMDGANRCGYRYGHDSIEGIVVVKHADSGKIYGLVLVENPGLPIWKLPRYQPPTRRSRQRVSELKQMKRRAFGAPARWIPL